jgi:short-subunit dehydrogenase
VKLDGANVIITGASSGIGRATAVEFATRGARLALVARNESALQDLAGGIRDRGGTVVVITRDLVQPGAPEKGVAAAHRQLGGVDILVNNAGLGMQAAIAAARESDVDHLFRLNVLAPAALIRAAVPIMRAQHDGMVINISSLAGRIVTPSIGYYSATKFALTVISDALRMEEGHHGIRVMTVFPGWTASRFTDNQLGSHRIFSHRRGSFEVSAEKVARRIAQAVLREERNVYISLIPDRLGVASNWLAGWAVSAVLARWARRVLPIEGT